MHISTILLEIYLIFLSNTYKKILKYSLNLFFNGIFWFLNNYIFTLVSEYCILIHQNIFFIYLLDT
jgi:hypothetical protein